MKLTSMNLSLPGCLDTTVLEVATTGLDILMDGYYNKGQGPDDFLLRDHCELTMGDHTADLVIDDAQFCLVYEQAKDVLNTIMLTQWDLIAEFLNTLEGYVDLVSLQYPGMIKLLVREERDNYGTGNIGIYIPESRVQYGTQY